jgi:hypothetical protein
MTVARPLAAFATAAAAGITENLSGLCARGEIKVKPDLACPLDGCCDGVSCPPEEHARHHSLTEKLVAGLRFALTAVWGDIAAWFFLGLILAGAITALVPEDAAETFLGGGLGSMLLMLAVGIPLYICATASTPIAAALILKGVSPGAALVFLLAGPATNATSLTVLLRILGKRGHGGLSCHDRPLCRTLRPGSGPRVRIPRDFGPGHSRAGQRMGACLGPVGGCGGASGVVRSARFSEPPVYPARKGVRLEILGSQGDFWRRGHETDRRKIFLGEDRTSQPRRPRLAFRQARNRRGHLGLGRDSGSFHALRAGARLRETGAQHFQHVPQGQEPHRPGAPEQAPVFEPDRPASRLRDDGPRKRL